MSEVASTSGVNKQAGVPLPAYGRAVIFGVAWLPALGLVAFFVPEFEDLFSRLRERAELPAVTERLLSLVWLNRALFFLPSVVAFVLLVFADIGLAGLLENPTRKWVYWI